MADLLNLIIPDVAARLDEAGWDLGQGTGCGPGPGPGDGVCHDGRDRVRL